MATPRKLITDRERFMRALERVSGPPRVRYSGDKFGTTVTETWWCPSCRTPKSLTLTYPDWLDYPKPRCSNCSDREIYEALDLQELAYRGSSPPLVYCAKAKAYRKRTGRWPSLPDQSAGVNGWKGSCRTCVGCVEFERRRQASVLPSVWSERFDELAQEAVPECAWGIRIPEDDFRRVMDQIRYHAKAQGGAVAQVPVLEGRAIVAVFSYPTHGRVTPLMQRLVADGECFRSRFRAPSDPQTGFVMIDIVEQTETFLIAAFRDRRLGLSSGTVKSSFVEYRSPSDTGR